MREIGKVKWYDRKKGYGFLTRERGADVFLHWREVERAGIDGLKAGDSIEFEAVQAEKGLRAANLALVTKD